MNEHEMNGAVITPRSWVAVSSEQVSCDLAGEAVVLSLRDGAYYGMNPVGARVWQLIQKPVAVSAVRDALLGEYGDVTADQCEREVVMLLTQLADWDLVQVIDPEAA